MVNNAGDPLCKNCGKCCSWKEDGKWKTCKFLIRFKSGTRCRIYHNRIGTKLGKTHVCGFRRDMKELIAGCPFNDLIKERWGDKAYWREGEMDKKKRPNDITPEVLEGKIGDTKVETKKFKDDEEEDE